MSYSCDRNRILIKHGADDDVFMPGTPQERIGVVWDLTCEAYALKGGVDVEQRLQRHIAQFVRK
ncbi:MAG: hypothetical protein WCI27_01990 [Candidatus Omnitrophota bacterium]